LIVNHHFFALPCVLALVATSVTAQEAAPAAPAPAAAPDEAVTKLLAAIDAGMVSIAGGTFRMGDISGRGFPDEKPVHQVTVAPFKLSRHEVTFEQYDAYAAATGKPRPSSQNLPRGTTPVMNVNWNEASEMIAWLNETTGLKYRLPSEAEWEYAARAGSSSEYPWGAAYDIAKANGNGKDGVDQWAFTSPVGSFPPNAWGLYDMVGNVWEWVQDCYVQDYDGAPTDGSARRSGLFDCTPVIRGGSWANNPMNLRVADRSWHDATYRYYFLGFRLARDE
jgi:formylglycine-generating enzyme required for sulfatase activity